jgi:hypothetical protein
MEIFLFVIIMLFTPKDALAYFDPGTGSLIIQVIVGALAFAAVGWRKIMEYIRSVFSKDNDTIGSTGTEKNLINDEVEAGEKKDENN